MIRIWTFSDRICVGLQRIDYDSETHDWAIECVHSDLNIEAICVRNEWCLKLCTDLHEIIAGKWMEFSDLWRNKINGENMIKCGNMTVFVNSVIEWMMDYTTYISIISQPVSQSTQNWILMHATAISYILNINNI